MANRSYLYHRTESDNLVLALIGGMEPAQAKQHLMHNVKQVA